MFVWRLVEHIPHAVADQAIVCLSPCGGRTGTPRSKAWRCFGGVSRSCPSTHGDCSVEAARTRTTLGRCRQQARNDRIALVRTGMASAMASRSSGEQSGRKQSEIPNLRDPSAYDVGPIRRAPSNCSTSILETTQTRCCLGCDRGVGQVDLHRMLVMGIDHGRPEDCSAGNSSKRGRSGRRIGRKSVFPAPAFGCEVDAGGPDSIRRTGSEPPKSALRPNEGLEQVKIAQFRALIAWFPAKLRLSNLPAGHGHSPLSTSYRELPKDTQIFPGEDIEQHSDEVGSIGIVPLIGATLRC